MGDSISRIARACALLALAGGCASAPVTEPVGRYEDTSYGLLRSNRYSAPGPIEGMRDWEMYMPVSREAVAARANAADPVTASGAQHFSWQAEVPMSARPRRGRFFLSGFLVGFMARIAYGAYQGVGGQGVSGSDVSSGIVIGAVTGLATWSFSFRLSPSQMQKTTPEQELPRLEDSSVYRDWASPRGK